MLSDSSILVSHIIIISHNFYSQEMFDIQEVQYSDFRFLSPYCY